MVKPKKEIIMSNSVSISFSDEPPGCIPATIFKSIQIEKIEEFILHILSDLKHDNWDLSILFCSDTFIQNLNNQYRKIDRPTDVLSFEQGETYRGEDGEKRFIAGDIVISLDTLAFNSSEFKVTKSEELKRLITHGILHLSGMDHSDNSPEQEMLKLQELLLDGYKNTILYLE